MKVILDANVLIAAFATRGLCHSLLESCLEHHEVFLSQELLKEIQKNLRKKIKLPPKLVAEIAVFLNENTTKDSPAKIPKTAFKDPSDLHVLGLAQKVDAHAIVTGDQALLELGDYKGIEILSPRDFWAKSRKEEGKS